MRQLGFLFTIILTLFTAVFGSLFYLAAGIGPSPTTQPAIQASVISGSQTYLDFTSTYSAGTILTGSERITFTTVMTNQETFTRTLTFYTGIPAGTVFITASANLSANIYGVTGLSTEPITSLSWSGQVGVSQAKDFTFTLQISPAGLLIQNTAVVARVFDEQGFQIVKDTITLTLAGPGGVVYLPLILKSSGSSPAGPTPTPSPTPSPTPANSLKISPGIAGSLQSQAADYNTALNGGGFVAGSDVIGPTPPEQQPYLIHSLVQCRWQETVYLINRMYFEFDTSAIPAGFAAARIEFYHYPAYPGPPAHFVDVYQGTWNQLLLPGGTFQVDPANWDKRGVWLARLEGTVGNDPLLSVFTIPKNYINVGGVTRFAFNTSTEGTAPLSHSCFGGANPGLGAGFSIPYLYIDPS